MRFTSDQQSETTPALGWWAVLVVLALGVPQCSLLVAKSMRLLSLNSSFDGAVQWMITVALFGTSNALMMTSSMVILASIMLLGGTHLKRLGVAVGYILCSVSVNLLVLVFVKYALQQFIASNGPDFRRLILFLFEPLSMATASLPFVAAMQFLRGWTIVPRGEHRVPRRLDLLTLLEWVLISAILFAYFRVTFNLKYQSNQVVLFYEMIMVLVPAIGIGIVTMFLLRWILAAEASRSILAAGSNRWNISKTAIRIVLLHALVYVFAFAALDWHDREITMHQNLQSAIAPLASCLVGTVYAAAIIYCLRRLGYRIVSDSTNAP